MKYAVLIPAYNAEKTIKDLLYQLRQLKKLPDKVILVDDGSKDNTAKIASEMQTEVIKITKNSGKGYALKKGFQYFINNTACDYLLCIDADLQHPVSSIPDFLNCTDKIQSQLIIGNRKKSIKKMPMHRILSNSITSITISFLTGQKIKDSQCGFRLIHRNLLKKLNLDENDFLIESEMILRTSENNIDIQFIDIPTIYSSEGSHINNIHVTIKFILLIYKELKRFFLKKMKK